MTSPNEAAKRLRTIRDDEKPMGWTREEWQEAVDRVIADERRATVERIRATIMGPKGSQIRSTSAYVGLLAILDEEAGR